MVEQDLEDHSMLEVVVADTPAAEAAALARLVEPHHPVQLKPQAQ